MENYNLLFGAIGAGAVLMSGLSSFAGMRYGLNGLRDRITRIEDLVESIPRLQQDIAVLKALKEEEARRAK